MNFQLYQQPGLMPAGAVPMYGASPPSLLSQHILGPRGMVQGGVRPLLGQPISMRPQMGQMQVAQLGQLPRQPGMFPRQPGQMMRLQDHEGSDDKRTPSPSNEKGPGPGVPPMGGMMGGIPPLAGLHHGIPMDAMGSLLGAPPGMMHHGMVTGAHMDAALKEETYDDGPVMLDSFNSDLNLKISPDGYSGQTLNEPKGFSFCWAGVRGTHGVTKGKVCFEVQVTDELPTDFGPDHKEEYPHVVRIGWSVDSHGFQLGEDPDSYGYGGTGRFSDNCKFRLYGESYGLGDTILAVLDFTSRPPTISYCKNGKFLGVAARLSRHPPGQALFPHVLSKNCRFDVNFGQRPPMYPAPPGCVFIGQVSPDLRVRGMQPPASVSDCEIIMVVGLPGSGKTTFGLRMQKENFDKRYNIIGTDTLIDKMKVMGLPRKNNYAGRWDALISMATACLNELFKLASRRCRNFILDQTNVYPSARKRKLNNFKGFKRICAVVQPDDPELKRREWKRTHEDGKFVPESAVLEMKANFTLPEESDPFVDEIRFVELGRQDASALVGMYRDEGKAKRPSRDEAFPHDSRKSQNPRESPGFGGNRPPYGSSQGRRPGSRDFAFSGGPSEKKPKVEQTSALDFIKQEYDEPQGIDHHAPYQHPWQQSLAGSVKQEPRDRPGEYDSALGRLPMSGGYMGQRSFTDQGRRYGGADGQRREAVGTYHESREVELGKGSGFLGQDRRERGLDWDQGRDSLSKSGYSQSSSQGDRWLDQQEPGSMRGMKREDFTSSSRDGRFEQYQSDRGSAGDQPQTRPWQQGQRGQQQDGPGQRLPPWQQNKQQGQNWPSVKEEPAFEDQQYGKNPGSADEGRFSRGQDSSSYSSTGAWQVGDYSSQADGSRGQGRSVDTTRLERGLAAVNRGTSDPAAEGYGRDRFNRDNRYGETSDKDELRGFDNRGRGFESRERGYEQDSRGQSFPPSTRESSFGQNQRDRSFERDRRPTSGLESQDYGRGDGRNFETAGRKSRVSEESLGYGGQQEKPNYGYDSRQERSTYDTGFAGSGYPRDGNGAEESRNRGRGRFDSPSAADTYGDGRSSGRGFQGGSAKDQFGSVEGFDQSRDTNRDVRDRGSLGAMSTRDQFADRADSSHLRGGDHFSSGSSLKTARDHSENWSSRDQFRASERFDSDRSRSSGEDRSRGSRYESGRDSMSGRARFDSPSNRSGVDSARLGYEHTSQPRDRDSLSRQSPYDSRSRFDQTGRDSGRSTSESQFGSPRGSSGSFDQKPTSDKPKKRSRWGPSDDSTETGTAPKTSPASLPTPLSQLKPGLGLLGEAPKPPPLSLLGTPPLPPPLAPKEEETAQSPSTGLLGAAPRPQPDEVSAATDSLKDSLLGMPPPKSLLPTPGEPSEDPDEDSGRDGVVGSRGGFSRGRGGFPPGGPMRGRGGPPLRGSMGAGPRGAMHPPQSQRGGFGQPQRGDSPAFSAPRGFNPRGRGAPSGVRSLFDSPVQRPRGMNVRGPPPRGPVPRGPSRGGFPPRF